MSPSLSFNSYYRAITLIIETGTPHWCIHSAFVVGIEPELLSAHIVRVVHV